MAENAMVKEQLTDSMIEAGAELTKKLDELGLPVTAAFWLFMPDVNEWRLLFTSPEVSSRGPLSVYTKISEAIEQLGAERAQVPMSSVGVIESEAELAQLLKLAVRKLAVGPGPGLSRIRFSKDVVNGHFIDDALIYRAA